MDGATKISVQTACWVTIDGEIDATNAEELAGALDQPISVFVDCSNLTLIDSAGMGVIIDAYNVLVRNGLQLRVVGMNGEPLRAFELLRLGYLLDDPDDE